MRVDQHRERVLEKLQHAYVAGLLSTSEYDKRIGIAFSTTQYDALHALIADCDTDQKIAKLSSQDEAKLSAILSGCERKGHWRVPARYEITCILGGCNIDLRQAQFASKETHIYIRCILGGISLRIPSGIRVEVHNSRSLLSGISNRTLQSRGEASVLHLHISTLLSGIEIKQKF